MNIGIVGNGIVGSATAKAFSKYTVKVTDSIRSKETHQLSDVLGCDLVFLCLPTPQKPNSLECDTSAIDSFFQHWLPERFKPANFVLKSTVPVGYTRSLSIRYGLPNIVHSPEFLSERTAEQDAANPARLIVGGDWSLCEPRFDGSPSCSTLLVQLYQETWPDVPQFRMTSDESEAVKLFQNAFSAVKIAVFNEFYSFAEKLGLDWNQVMEALLAGGWINHMHTQVPGPDGKRGFGGTCLPKDLANLISCMKSVGLPQYVCRSAMTRNLDEDRISL